MELRILDVQNLPSKPVLSVHAGSIHRQTQLEVNRPFVIPHPGMLSSMTLTVYEQMASQQLPVVVGNSTCEIPIRKAGTSSQVLLKIDTEAQVGNSAAGTASARTQTAPEEYLDNHRLQERLKALMQDVFSKQPADPYRFMLNQLRSLKESESGGKGLPAAQQLSSPQVPTLQGRVSPVKPSGAPGPCRPGGASRPGRHLVGSKKDDVPAADSKRGWAPRTQVQHEARAAVRLILTSSRCAAAADASMRSHAQSGAAESMAASIVILAKEQLVQEASHSVDAPEPTRASVLRGGVYPRSPPFVATVPSNKGDPAVECGLNSPLPMPIVSLDSACDWGRSLG